MSKAKPARAHRRQSGGHEEEHENTERWLLTYADMITLLMVLFIVMFAVSQVDQKKFAQLRNGLATGFGAQSVAFSGDGTTVSEEQSDMVPFNLGSGIEGNPERPQDKTLREAKLNADRENQQRMQQDAQRELKNLEEIKQKILVAAQQAGLADSIRFTVDERGLVVTIVATSVVFAGDRAELLPAGQEILNAVGPALTELPNKIEVDGHTNQLPVPTVNYPSAWELSSARASTVVRYLIGHAAIAPVRMLAAGFAGERPLYPPDSPLAPTLNRRVEIIVLSTLPAPERALLPSAAGRLTH